MKTLGQRVNEIMDKVTFVRPEDLGALRDAITSTMKDHVTELEKGDLGLLRQIADEAVKLGWRHIGDPGAEFLAAQLAPEFYRLVVRWKEVTKGEKGDKKEGGDELRGFLAALPEKIRADYGEHCAGHDGSVWMREIEEKSQNA